MRSPAHTHLSWSGGVSGISQIDLSFDFEGEGGELDFFGDWPRFGFGANGMVEVDVNTGRSFLFMTEAGVEVLGGSQRRGSC